MQPSWDIDEELQSVVDNIRNDDGSVTTYGLLAPIYDYLFGESYDYELQAKYVREYAPESGAFRLLEAGCGTGRLLSLLADTFPDADLHGVDLHEGMVSLARERVEDADNATVTQGDALAVGGEYEVVSVFNLLPHFDDGTLSAFFRHVASLLTDGGLFILDYKDPRNNPNGLYDVWTTETEKFHLTARFLTVYHDGQPHYAVAYEFVDKAADERYRTGELMEIHFQTPDRLEKQLHAAGFDVVTVDRGVGDQSGVVVARAAHQSSSLGS